MITKTFQSVSYQLNGSGKDWIIFTHGATADSDLFRHQVRFFSNYYSVLTWDVPGHGASAGMTDISMNRAVLLLKQIMDRENISSAHFAGQSMGGYICQMFADSYPDMVASIALIGSTPIGQGQYSSSDMFWLSVTPAILKLYPEKILINSIARNVSETEEGRRHMHTSLSGLGKRKIMEIMAEVYKAVKEYNVKPIELSMPIFISYGEKDRAGKVQTYSNRFASTGGHQIYSIPYANHNANIDNPEDFNRAYYSFLKSIKISD